MRKGNFSWIDNIFDWKIPMIVIEKMVGDAKNKEGRLTWLQKVLFLLDVEVSVSYM